MDSAEVVLEALASALLEGAREDRDSGEVIGAEDAEVVAGFAPGGEGPGAGPAVEGEGADDASGGEFAVEGGVVELEDVLAEAGGVEDVEELALGGGHAEAGGVEQDLVEAVGECGWEDGFDAGEGRTGSSSVFSAAHGLDEAGAEDEGREFFGGEHEGWEIEVAAQGVADAGFAFDGLAVELEVANVAIDGSFGDLEPLGESASGLQATGAEELHDAEEPVGASHGSDCTAWAAALVSCGCGDRCDCLRSRGCRRRRRRCRGSGFWEGGRHLRFCGRG